VTSYEANNRRQKLYHGKLPSEVEEDNGESFNDGDDAPPDGGPMSHSEQLLSLVLREDDISEAVDRVREILLCDAKRRIAAANGQEDEGPCFTAAVQHPDSANAQDANSAAAAAAAAAPSTSSSSKGSNKAAQI